MFAEIALLACAFQAQESTLLGTSPWLEEKPVMLVNRVRLDDVQLPIAWWQLEKHEPASSMERNGSVRRRELRKVQDNILVMNEPAGTAVLAALTPLQPPSPVSLPCDGRILVGWEPQSGLVQVQMGFQARKDSMPERARFGWSRTEQPRSKVHLDEHGRIAATERLRGDDDLPAYVRWHIFEVPESHVAGREDYDASVPAVPGILEVRTDRVGPFALFQGCVEDRGRNWLCVAKTEDGGRYWLWMEAEEAQ